jgi:hypothetical protein
MEKDTTTQVENDERFAWFNGNNKISIGTIDLNEDILSDVPDYIQFDIIKALKLRNQLNVAINDYLETIKELDENN